MELNSTAEPDRLLRRAEVERMVGLRRSALYAKMERGEFPRPLKIGRAVRWISHEIRAWCDSLPRSHGDRD